MQHERGKGGVKVKVKVVAVIWQELHFPIGFHLREQLSAERGSDIRLGQAK